MLKVHRLDLL